MKRLVQLALLFTLKGYLTLLHLSRLTQICSLICSKNIGGYHYTPTT